MEEVLKSLRDAGWQVAVHNDYTIGTARMTFWLMTHPSGVYLKGEGFSDRQALELIATQVRRGS